jgi:Cdc6-like AAA superfamily ATPase
VRIEPEDFADGAVKVQEQKLQGHLGGLIEAFPVAMSHRAALRSLGSDFVYAAPSPLANDRGSWIALIRFGSVIERRFGLTREVIAYYSPHKDLQLRTYQRLDELIDSAPRPATPDVFLLWTPDAMTGAKLDDWSSRAAYVAVALPRIESSSGAEEIWANIVNRLTTTNLYDQTLPVTGRDFFGRQATLKELTSHLVAGRVSGVFGLRKTGKTSLVKELGRRVSARQDTHQIFVLRDLETLPSAELDQVPNLLEDLRVNLLAELRTQGLRTFELVELPHKPTVSDFRRSLHTLLGHINKSDVNVVLALDEIESLVGPASARDSDRPEVVELLGALRALVQENPNFNVIVSGLTSSILEEGQLFSRENPFFAWASTIFLPRLTSVESKDILVRLGERMAITWDDESAARAAEIADGHVFLLRTLAAKVVQTLPSDLTARTISIDILENTQKRWRRSVAGHVREMLESVSRYYPDEHSLLDLLLEDPSQFETIEEQFPSQIEHLIQLGLVAEGVDGLRLTALAAFDGRGPGGLQ